MTDPRGWVVHHQAPQNGEDLLPTSVYTTDLPERGDFVGDASAVSPRHDQQCGSCSQTHRPVNQVLRCHGIASRRDVAIVAPVVHAPTVEQFKSPLDPDLLFDT